MSVQPFPWSSLDRVKRADLAALARMRCGLGLGGDPAVALASLARTIRGDVQVKLRRAEHRRDAAPLAGGIGILLAEESSGSSRQVLVQMEAPLAAVLVARALGRPPPRVTDNKLAISPNLAGALGAILVTIARSACADAPLRVEAAGSSHDLAGSLGNGSSTFDAATFTVLVDNEAFLARVTMPVHSATTLSGRPMHAVTPWSRRALAALGDVRLEVPIVTAVSTTTLADLATLGVDDAFVPGAWLLRRENGEWTGSILLAAPDREEGVWAGLGEGNRLVLRGGVESLEEAALRNAGKGKDVTMGEQDEIDPLVEAVGEVPIVVRVEMGSARMAAREWAALAPGDVITLHRPMGGPVILRVGGAEVARGELVDVEGEVGVRIVAKTVARATDKASS